MNQKSKLFYQCIGAFIICCAIFLFYLACKKNPDDQPPSQYYTLVAYFPDVTGLKQDSLVQLSGIPIGYIKYITLDKNYFAHVILRIKKNFIIPSDSRALIYSESLLGKKYIIIKPGLSNKPLKNGQSFLYTQGTIALQNLLQILLNKKRINK